MIDLIVLEKAAMAMTKAYKQEQSMEDAVQVVARQFQEIRFGKAILMAMWYAVDAFDLSLGD